VQHHNSRTGRTGGPRSATERKNVRSAADIGNAGRSRRGAHDGLHSLIAGPDVAHAQCGVPWRHTPSNTAVGLAGDPRLLAVDEAVSFWNRTLEEIGSGFRLGPIMHTRQPVPEEALQPLSQAASEAISPSELLLKHIRTIFNGTKEDRISTSELLRCLCLIEEGPWSTYEYGRQLTSGGLARLLRPHGILSIQHRFDGERNTRGYAKTDFEEAWERYTQPEIAATSATDDAAATSRGVSTTQHVPTPSACQ
jgi:hypothetical protein